LSVGHRLCRYDLIEQMRRDDEPTQPEHVVCAGTASKTLAPGLRRSSPPRKSRRWSA
jgi:DNA-binding transcriptional MocR family regulator